MQEVDFGAGTFAFTKDRLEVINYMTPFLEEPGTFIIRSPQGNTMTLYLNPFHVSETILLWD